LHPGDNRGVSAPTLTPLELACGFALGADLPVAELSPTGGSDVRAALAAEIAPLLQRSPCVVSFSGGRDSSAVLAIATLTARDQGLPDPIPVTLRFADVASTQESCWQEAVVTHLGLRDWQRIDIGDELDLLGDVATGVLRRHGLLWPPNAYLHEPILQHAVGGALLSGLDGDGLFGTWRWARMQALLRARVRPRRQDAVRAVGFLTPYAVRRRLPRGSAPVQAAPWVRPMTRGAIVSLVRDEAAREPRRFDRRVAWYVRRRYLRLTVAGLEAIASDHDVQVASPLLGSAFLSALARRGGAAGFGVRSAAMDALFGDLLPDTVVRRPTKAEFGRSVWRERARAFAASWAGHGVDPTAVDADALREEWRLENPLFGAGTLLHAAWLSSQSGS
jgi:hypothetical protein